MQRWWTIGLLSSTLAMVIAKTGRADQELDASRTTATSRLSKESAARTARLPTKVPSGAVAVAPAPVSTAPRVTSRAPAAATVRVPLAHDEGAKQGEPKLDANEFAVTAGGGRIDATDAEKPVLEMPADALTIVTSKRGKASVQHETLSATRKTALPWLVVETRPSHALGSVRTARPFLTLAKAIAWVPAANRHVAEFLFGLDPQTGEAGPLGHPLDIRFSVTCDDVTPTEAKVDTVGPAGYGIVTVSCSREIKNARERQFLEIFAGNGNLRYPFAIPRRPGSLTLVASSSDVLGLGFDTFALTVSRFEEDGSPLRAPADQIVQLIAEGGDLDVAAVTIPKGTAEASVEARSRGVGEIRIRAQSGPLKSEAAALAMAWPIVPVLAMVLGGALGGLSSTLGGKHRRKMRRRVLEGSIVGLLVTVVALALPGVTAISARLLGTELGLFVVAAFAGFIGTPLLDRAAQLVFPKLEEGKGAPPPADSARAG